ncbi:hypothetical protein CONPUDRAFT_160712 [Coniophora puteana RWD-64-598 SS2]|uniref:CCHC-type domain-containing protein n=1 Tax=Coniophora puteana (strain RWD-64-598) TaxID=741705 RepID=R7SDF6_CONPW|nr:uncharacterized protein CONPUDRAFT_160712 [Coniophora puteana RWD-64-598 SS2]EIW73787.1 hypothetical protein CONPUDRAFT_160712 [Coniophora puteana RWD-64-598 SS2]
MSSYIMSFVNNDTVTINRHGRDATYNKTSLHDMLLIRSPDDENAHLGYSALRTVFDDPAKSLAVLANLSDSPHTTVGVIIGTLLNHLDETDTRIREVDSSNYDAVVNAKFKTIQDLWHIKQGIIRILSAFDIEHFVGQLDNQRIGAATKVLNDPRNRTINLAPRPAEPRPRDTGRGIHTHHHNDSANSNSSYFPAPRHLPAEIRRRQDRPRTPYPFPRPVQPLKCWFCKKEGHRQRYCPDRLCRKCWRMAPGHRTANCPEHNRPRRVYPTTDEPATPAGWETVEGGDPWSPERVAASGWNAGEDDQDRSWQTPGEEIVMPGSGTGTRPIHRWNRTCHSAADHLAMDTAVNEVGNMINNFEVWSEVEGREENRHKSAIEMIRGEISKSFDRWREELARKESERELRYVDDVVMVPKEPEAAPYEISDDEDMPELEACE